MSKPVWISEKEASEMMNKHPRYFRSLVKSGELSISYRHDEHGRNWEYNEKDIEVIKNKNAFIIHKVA